MHTSNTGPAVKIESNPPGGPAPSTVVTSLNINYLITSPCLYSYTPIIKCSSHRTIAPGQVTCCVWDSTPNYPYPTMTPQKATFKEGIRKQNDRVIYFHHKDQLGKVISSLRLAVPAGSSSATRSRFTTHRANTEMKWIPSHARRGSSRMTAGL